jgi:AraC-like DNA-binding protein
VFAEFIAHMERFAGEASVGALVRTLPPDSYANIHRVAKAMRMSTRRLQRCLHEGGTTFRRIVVMTRVDAARQLIDEPARKIVDIALELGYSDQAHFTRAFVRWSGVTPRAFRRRAHRDEGSDAGGGGGGNHEIAIRIVAMPQPRGALCERRSR